MIPDHLFILMLSLEGCTVNNEHTGHKPIKPLKVSSAVPAGALSRNTDSEGHESTADKAPDNLS